MTASAFHFILLNGLAIAAAWAAGSLGFRAQDMWRRGLAALVVFGVIVEGATLIVGTTVGLRLSMLEVLVGIVAMLLCLAVRRTRRGEMRKQPLPAPPRDGAGTRATIAAGVLGAAAGVWMVVSLFSGTQFNFDDLTYHAAVPARWLTEGGIHLVPFTYQAYYPHNAALLTLWFLLPFGSDALASLGTLWAAAVLMLSTFGLVKRLGASSTAASYAAALVACSGVPVLALAGFAHADVAGAAAAAAALALAGPRPVDLLFSGLALGFAVGSRVSFVTIVPCLLAWWLVASWRSPGRRSFARGVTLFAAALALTSGYWYIQNAVLTGNPLFPAAFGPFDGPFDAASQARTKLATWIARSPVDGAQWTWILARLSPWPLPFFLVSLAGGVVGTVHLAGWRKRPAATLFLACLLAVVVVQLVQFPFLPFSGTYNRPFAGLDGIATRYLLLPFALGIALFAGLGERALRRAWIFDGVALATLASAVIPLATTHGGPLLVVGGLTGAVVGVALARRAGLRSSAARPTAVSALLLVFLAASVLAFPEKQRRTDARLFAVGSSALPVGRGWRTLESLSPGSHIAFFMAEPYEYTSFYPLFGRRLQHVPVPVERDGSPRTPLHLRARDGWWSDWKHIDEPVDPVALAANLTASGVDHVLVSRWTLGRWPPHRAAVEAIPGARKLYDDGSSALYVLPGPWPAAPR